jgi:hypothetical protein
LEEFYAAFDLAKIPASTIAVPEKIKEIFDSFCQRKLMISRLNNFSQMSQQQHYDRVLSLDLISKKGFFTA